MTTPTCPTDYSCTFTLTHPRVIYHSTDPWWQGTGGWIAGVLVGVAIVCLIAYIVTLISDHRDSKNAREENERNALMQQTEQREQREHQLALEEQRTMQIDAAKGNPEMLKIVQDMQK